MVVTTLLCPLELSNFEFYSPNCFKYMHKCHIALTAETHRGVRMEVEHNSYCHGATTHHCHSKLEFTLVQGDTRWY